MKWQGYVSVCLVALQFGIQPFLSENFLDKDAIKSTIVMVQEIVKISCCFAVLLITGQLPHIFKSWTLKKSIVVALIPALIYCTQNVLAFYAYLNLDPLLYNLINQSKVIFAAIFLKLILNKSQTNTQMIALCILFGVSIMLALDSITVDTDNGTKDNVNTNSALIAIVVASMMSGFAGTLTQKALQSLSSPRNSLLFSSELGIYGILFTLFRVYVESTLAVFDGALVARHGFWYHWNNRALIPIVTNAIGGIGVGLIAKYASVIHKSYALISGILLSGVIRSFVFNERPMSITMYAAVPLVMLAIFLNTKPKTKTKKKKP